MTKKFAFKKKKKRPTTDIIQELEARYKNINVTKIEKFTDLPLTKQTLKGLKEQNFVKMTDIQKQSIPLILQNHDVLGAAQTGSGKTLAFLVPILERLYCNNWTHVDGLGALVISPTRELAYQIAETLRKVGMYHNFSIGLIFGGKDAKREKEKLQTCNILVATPGKLLEHLETNNFLETSYLKIVVLDEADRMLDSGFKEQLDCIISYLPPERQTLLFSATQTKSVKDLARLSLKDPLYVSVHEHASTSTPDGLQQSYIVCELEDKLALLYSFLCNHSKQKIIVFFASCNQVKFMYEAFCHLRPGISLLSIYGKQSQLKRTTTYQQFHGKQFAALFCTDVAARGLDFPNIDWVVQMDCPEDVDSYIHRSGRTARFQKSGESLLILLPSEVAMIEQLKKKKIPINKIQVNQNKLHSPIRKLEALLARNVEIKESAQRAVVSYIKGVFLMKDKSVFNVHALNTDAFAKSLGLAIPPRIRFLQRHQKKENNDKAESSEGFSKEDKEKEELSDGENKSLEQAHSSSSWKNAYNYKSNDDFDLNDDDDDDDLLTVKRKVKNKLSDDELAENDIEEASQSKNKKVLTKAAIAKKLLKKKIVANKKITFDEEGQEQIDSKKSKTTELGRQYEQEDEGGIDINLAKKILEEEDQNDKKLYREKIRKKKLEQKAKKKMKDKRKEESEEDIEDSDEEAGAGKVGIKEYNDSGSGSEDDSYEEPDLSWLPDPDVIYGKKKGSDEEDDSDKEEGSDDEEDSDREEDSDKEGSDDEDDGGDDKSDSSVLDSDEEQIHRPMKRKLIAVEPEGKKKKRKHKLEDNANLQADEDLALRLLGR